MEANLTDSMSIDTTNDGIVIVKCLEDIPGGRTLDVTGWPHTIIPAGHPIIKDSGEYKPLALNSEGDAIETGAGNKAESTIGILKASILTQRPFAAIMVRGTVNEAAANYVIPNAAKTAVSLIRFTSED